MAITYEPISTVTLSSDSIQINFTSISNAYTDLRLVVFGVYTSSSFLKFTLNSNTSANYSNVRIGGNGSSSFSDKTTGATYQRVSFDGHTSTVPNFLTVDFFSYAGSIKKSYLITNSDDKNGSGGTYTAVGQLDNSTAITSIQLAPFSGQLAAGTTATLYGILKA
jgi:hypothetical protein